MFTLYRVDTLMRTRAIRFRPCLSRSLPCSSCFFSSKAHEYLRGLGQNNIERSGCVYLTLRVQSNAIKFRPYGSCSLLRMPTGCTPVGLVRTTSSVLTVDTNACASRLRPFCYVWLHAGLALHGFFQFRSLCNRPETKSRCTCRLIFLHPVQDVK